MQPNDLSNLFQREQERYLREWTDLLAFPSVSTDPDRHADCLACAAWLQQHLAALGFQAEQLPTPGKPVVFACRKGRPDRPTVLFYGHYDVQPADPLAEWLSPPFTPTLRNGRLYARGAQDNKGQLFYALKAMEALIRADALDCTVKILLEGEEECGSNGISLCLPDWKDRLQADLLLVTDTGTVASGAPTLVMGLRGIVQLTAAVVGPKHDLHSGMHGGLAPNPAEQLARLVTSLHNADGSIAVPGFYDGLEGPSREEWDKANEVELDAARYEEETGVPPVGGETRYTAAERLGFRPSIDINGLTSGFGGAGTKTIIPARAQVNLTARLVPGQDPERCLQAIADHLQRNLCAGLKLEIISQGASGPGFRLPLRSRWVTLAGTVLRQVTGREPAFLWEGASIPVVTQLARVAGAQPLLSGFGYEEDRIHAPNESFSIEQFKLGFLYVAELLRRI